MGEFGKPAGDVPSENFKLPAETHPFHPPVDSAPVFKRPDGLTPLEPLAEMLPLTAAGNSKQWPPEQTSGEATAHQTSGPEHVAEEMPQHAEGTEGAGSHPYKLEDAKTHVPERSLISDAEQLQSDAATEIAVTREYPNTTEAEGIWSATLTVPPDQSYDQVKQQIEHFTMDTGFPVSAFMQKEQDDTVHTVTVVRDPSRRFGTLPPEAHEHATGQLQTAYGWTRQPVTEAARPDVSACVGLLEGFDEATGTVHEPVEALAYLLEHGSDISWRTRPVTLLSARRTVNAEGQPVLQSWDERVMHIVGTRRRGIVGQHASPNPALDVVKGLAASFNQERFFADDGVGDKTIAFDS